MADAQPTNPATDAGTATQETVEQLKKELAEKSKELALSNAKFSTYEDRQRKQLAELQPTVAEFVKEGLELGGDHKIEMEPMLQFADSLKESKNVDSAMPLARMISVHSAKFKREREEFSKTKDAAEELAKANKELDEIKADRDSKASRISELETLADERLNATEKLQEELAKAGLMQKSYEFSNLSSRESGAADAGSTEAGSVSGAASTASSSKAAANPLDSLMSFVGAGGSRGSRTMMPSATGHSFLGNAGGDGGIAAALRFA